ncbi:MAG: hypothetical protein HOG97_05245 [Candidatus Marinimicrobia bacterium]|jgi:hypothetical protein|nr:hypothetical protein [Candidatus Neomarinimicrobiota bacterium]
MKDLEKEDFFQKKCRGKSENDYELYRSFANNGKGGDIINNGKPLKTYQEWLGLDGVI